MVRDFSQKTVQELYETIRVNVDEEEQWKVFDFVEDFFMEELEIGDYINDINSYHLHMFDKHDVTTKKFDAIVEKAGKVDANYAAQIEGYCSLLGEYGKKFEAVCAMLALDLIGVKVFRYSDETAEAVASGEKLLKESQTVYESFADMMSPDDAAKYLDFLENGSKEGLTSAELAGVEKADALLVSQKVEYEDVWDLRNPCDVLESGINSIDDIALKHSSVGDFTYNPKTGQISRMKGGGHGQSNINFLEENGIEYNIVKEYDNGVRVGNVPKHKTPSKRTGTGQAWFPKNWSDSKIKEAGNYVTNLPDNKNLPDGVIGYGEYDGVRVGIIKTDGKIGTIFPDADLQP